MTFISEQVGMIALMVSIAIFIVIAIIAVPIIIRRKRTVIKGSTVSRRELSDIALNVIDALGSRSNIIGVETSISKIKFALKDVKLANIDKLNKIGASGVVETSNSLTVIFGSISKELGEAIIK